MVRIVVRFLVVAAVVVFVAPAAQAQQNAPYAADRIIVKYHKGVSGPGVAPPGLPAGASVAIVRRFRSGSQLMRIRGIGVEEVIAHFSADPRVEYVEPDYFVSIEQTPARVLPDDPRLAELYGLDNTGQTGGTPDADIDAPEAWTIRTGADVLIGVIDTGVDWRHEDIAANIWTNPGEIPDNGIDDDGNGFVDDVRGWDFFNGDNDPMDDNRHGTHVAGTIAAVGDNGVGVSGVCWKARLLPIKILDGSGRGTISAAIAGIEYSIRMGARLSNNSWGSAVYSRALEEAVAAVADAGALFIAAAGNDGRNSDYFPHYPASYDFDHIVSVANSDHNDQLSATSNYGVASVDLSAPGTLIRSLVPADRYGVLSGTSMAAPHVTGAAALLLAEAPLLSPTEAKTLLMSTVDPVPAMRDNAGSHGRLNAWRALSALDETPPARIDDLRVTQTGSNTVTLGWTAGGDDGDAGAAAVYDLRYSDTPIKPSTFERATPVGDVVSPAVAGTPETFRIGGLDVKTTYFFAIRVLDERLNVSDVSNVVAGRTRGTPELSYTPGAFGGVALSGASVSRRMTITNSGKGSIDFAFSPGAQGWVTATPDAGTVPARHSVDVTVMLDALDLAGGAYDDVLTLSTNDPSAPAVELSARLEVTSAPHLVVSDEAVDFGEWFVGAGAKRQLSVTNHGDRMLNVTGVEIVGEGFFADVSPVALVPGTGHTFTVEFAPPVPGEIEARLRVASDDPDAPVVTIALRGRGLPAPEISVSPSQLVESLHTGAILDRTMTIVNGGDGELEWALSIDDDEGAPDPGRPPDEEGPFRNLEGVRILYDAAHRNLHWFNYNTVFIDLKARGAEIVVSKPDFTREYLDGFDVVWMAESFFPVARREQDALVGWVRAGGGLLLEGDYEITLPTFNGILRALLSGIEISFENGTTGITNNIETHETTRDVRNVFLSRVTATLIEVRPPARPLIYDVENVPNTAWSRAGAGRIFVMADQNFANHRMGGTGNRTLCNRVIDWLAVGVPWLDASPRSGVLAPGKSQALDLRVDASGLGGPFDARVVVRSNDPGQPVVVRPVHLDVAPAPDIVMRTSELRFPKTAVERASEADVEIGNIGAADLEIVNVTSTHAAFAAQPGALVVAPGGKGKLTVVYSPADDGRHHGVMTLHTSDPDAPARTIVVSGASFVGVPGEVTVSLSAGLNLCSWGIDTKDDAPSAVLAGLLPKLVQVNGFEGGKTLVFQPGVQDRYNTLKRLDHLGAYWIEMSAPGEVTLEGFVVDPRLPIPLGAGWNAVAYLPKTPDDPAHALRSVLENVDIVTGFEGRGLVYSPDAPDELNTLRFMKPTQGYLVRMNAPDTLVYPDSTTTLVSSKHHGKPVTSPLRLALPIVTSLHQNFPNPFNPSTTIRYDLSETAAVRLVVYNPRGQAVRTLVEEVKSPGRYAVRFDGTNDAGEAVATGVYFYRLDAGRFTRTRKMILLK